MSDSFRARVKVLVGTAIAVAFGLGLASAFNLAPVSVAADSSRRSVWPDGTPGDARTNMETGFADVAARVAPAVVTVYSAGERQRQRFQLPPGFGDRFGLPSDENEEGNTQTQFASWTGAGFIISDDGYVVTNNHVVAGAERIDIQLSDGQRFHDAELVGRDPQTDVALLKVDATELTALPIGSSDETRVGEWVLAIGSPGFSGVPVGELNTTVTSGIVSAKGRTVNILRDSQRNPLAIEDFIQTDAAINRGNSGGPLVNAAGEVIGINTAILSTTGAYQGYGFAVPIELAREVVDDLIEFGEVRRALIGVAITDVNAADAEFYQLDRVEGALVQNFSLENSPAREGGLLEGDVITGAAGQPVADVSELQRRIRAFDPGESVTLDIVRRATLEAAQVRIKLVAAGQPPPAEPLRRTESSGDWDALGLEVREYGDLTPAERRQLGLSRSDADSGVVIVGGDMRGAVARQVGAVPAGRIIFDINGEQVASREDYDRLVNQLGPGEVASLRYSLPGDGWSSTVSVVIPEN